jgi:hypothetical protein
MKFKNRFKELEKRIQNDKILFEENDDEKELNEALREWDFNIQDISHELDKPMENHESRKGLKIELRRYLYKRAHEIWNQEQKELKVN